MSASLNKVTLIGNLGRDPEIRTTQSGGRVAGFSLATGENWRDRETGERRERTEWHRVVAFGDGLAGVVEQYVRKGSRVYVEGALQTRRWTDASGQERYSTEIVLQPYNGKLIMLDGGNGRDRGAEENTAGEGSGYVPQGASGLDDEVPFAPQVL